MEKMLNIKINGMDVTVPYGTKIIDAARMVGIEIPTLCYLKDINEIIQTGDYSTSEEVSERAKNLKHALANLRKEQTMRLHQSQGSLRMDFVYLNVIQESHELLSEVRNLLRGSNKLFAAVNERK